MDYLVSIKSSIPGTVAYGLVRGKPPMLSLEREQTLVHRKLSSQAILYLGVRMPPLRVWEMEGFPQDKASDSTFFI